MYPGTYQPLQALSLLLADLLQHPYSDNAALSHGIVDLAFELYQVDGGIISQYDPPQRRLSPSGRDAWALLVRTRRKALEQVGMDHHVVTPSNVVSSNACVCGAAISSENQQRSPQENSDVLVRAAVPAHHVMSSGMDDLTPGQTLIGSADFDWRVWDNALGGSVGMMP